MSGSKRDGVAGLRIPMPSSSQAVPIPSQPFRGSASVLGTQPLYGSPTPISHISQSAPGIGFENLESPFRQGGTPRTPSGAQRSPSRPRRRTRRSGQEWSLFSELMENEGQAISPRHEQGPSSPILKRRSSRLSTSTTPQHLTGAPSQTISSPGAFAEEDYFPEESDQEDSDGYDDRDTEDTSSTPSSSFVAQEPPTGYRERLANIPTLYKNIFKCSLAYLIGSLFTFSPLLSGLIADLTPGDDASTLIGSGHMVATIVVYFVPAATTGGMLQANLFVFLGFFYASFICLSSMSFYWWLERMPGWEWAGDVIVISWIGIGMSVLAWMKVWMANPAFNTACSMTSIILFTVIMKEAGAVVLLQMCFIVITGAIITNLICHLIWRQTATDNLQTNISKSLDSFATVLAILSATFLLEAHEHVKNPEKLQKAVDGHQSSFTTLKKNLNEAKTEWAFRGSEEKFDLASAAMYGINMTAPQKKSGRPWGESYEDVVDSLNRLAQHLNGLRSSTRIQHELCRSGLGRMNGVAEDQTDDEDEGTALLRAAAAIFGDLVDDIGPPLKALSTTSITCLKRLKESFSKRGSPSQPEMPALQPHEFVTLIESIEKAVLRFESTSNHAMIRVYRRSDMLSESRLHDSLKSLRDNSADDNAALEHIFVVYYFVFTLQEFANELVSLIDAMAHVAWIEQRRKELGPWWKRLSKRAATFVSSAFQKLLRPRKAIRPALSRTSALHNKRSFSTYIIPDKLKNHRHYVAFPKVRPHAPDTILTPSSKGMGFSGRMKRKIWAFGHQLRERNSKFAIKTGLSMAALAAPGFFDVSRPFFVKYSGQWALISFIVVMSPTIGATNNMSLHRVLGTIFGALLATATFTFFGEYPAFLAVFGFFFSLPAFYVIVSRPPLASTARLTLLSYNLTCLYSYNLRQHDVPVLDIALRRMVAVTAGVLWAAFISRVWWPAEARRELSRALGEFCLNLGWLYMRLVTLNSYSLDTLPEEEQDPGFCSSPSATTALMQTGSAPRTSKSIREFMAMELHLQIQLIEIQGLLAQAQHEPRLKGPFPVKLYRSMLTHLQMILDKLHSMRCVTTKEEWYTEVRNDFIIPVNKERKEMVGNIILSFSVLSSAFRVKAPLPPYLPPAEKARQALVDAIQKLDIVKNREVNASRQLLFFAYALTMRGVTLELDALGRELQEAFGVIGQTPEEFDQLFIMERQELERRQDVERSA